MTGRKRSLVNYKEDGFKDSSRDSDYEAVLKPPPPLDNKSYPSASRIATQHLIEMNRANKQTKSPENGSLPAATEPIRKSARLENQNAENNVLPDDMRTSETLPVPDETNNPNPVGKDATTPETEPMLPDATNEIKSPGTPSKDGNPDTITPTDNKPSRGVFKTKNNNYS